MNGNDPFLKRLEYAWKRILLASLRSIVGQRHSHPLSVDPAPAKILFIRQDRIGDVLMSTPIMHAAKKKYPDAVVDALLSVNNHFVLQNDSTVNKRWIYRKGLFSSLRLLFAVRRERYDVAVDLLDNTSATSTLFLLCIGARHTIGLDKENSFAYDILCPMLDRKETHILDRLSELLVPLGIQPEEVERRIFYTVGGESQRGAAQFRVTNFRGSPIVVGINISAGSESRYWGTRKYIELISAISNAKPGTRFLILSKLKDTHRADEIAASSSAAKRAPETSSFDEFAAYISSVDLLISPDTAAVHVAAAFRIPVVALYVHHNPDLRIWEPVGTLNRCLVTDTDALGNIPVQSVADAASELISEISTH